MTPEQQAAFQAALRHTPLIVSMFQPPVPVAPPPEPFLQRWGLPIAAGLGALAVGLGIAYVAR